jgi:hypothetical protein
MPKKPNWRKTKPTQNHPSSEPKQNGARAESENSGLHLRGRVEIDLAPNLRNQHDTEYQQTASHGKKQLIATIIATIGAFLVALLTFWQGCLTRQAVNNAAEQFQIDQRPYVSVVDDPEMIDLYTKQPIQPIIGKPIVVDIRYKNIGKSVALNVLAYRHLLFGPQPGDIRADAIQADSARAVTLDPSAKNLTSAVSIKDSFTNQSIVVDPSELVMWDGSEIVLFGRISYQDIFGNSYCTPFAMRRIPGGWNYLNQSITKKLCPAELEHKPPDNDK